MNDPIMCSRQNRMDERDVALRLAKYHGYTVGNPTDTLSVYDVSLWLEDKLRFLVEVKTRNYVWGEYPLDKTYNIGENKIKSLLALAGQFPGVGVWLAVKDRHGDIYYRLIGPTEKFERRMGGRRDRRNISTDQEMMLHIPVESFLKLP